MNFNIKCIGKLSGPTNEFERSLVFETGEFERPKFDCIYLRHCFKIVFEIFHVMGRWPLFQINYIDIDILD